MGTSGLSDVLVHVDQPAEGLRGKTLAVDAHNALYAGLTGIRDRNGEPLRGPHGGVTSRLIGLVNRHQFFLEHGIGAIYVFEPTQSHPLKAAELARRHAGKQDALEQLQAAQERGDMEAVRRLLQRTLHLTKEMAADARRVLAILGVPVVTAATEGEAEAANLVRQGACHGVASQDYDVILFGGDRLIRDLAPGRMPQLVHRELSLHHLGVPQNLLVDACILAGTDFNTGAYGVGVKTALKLLQKHGSIEGILELSGKQSPVVERIQAYVPAIPLPQIRDLYQAPKVNEYVFLETTMSPGAPEMLWEEFGLKLNLPSKPARQSVLALT